MKFVDKLFFQTVLKHMQKKYFRILFESIRLKNPLKECLCIFKSSEKYAQFFPAYVSKHARIFRRRKIRRKTVYHKKMLISARLGYVKLG